MFIHGVVLTLFLLQSRATKSQRMAFDSTCKKIILAQLPSHCLLLPSFLCDSPSQAVMVNCDVSHCSFCTEILFPISLWTTCVIWVLYIDPRNNVQLMMCYSRKYFAKFLNKIPENVMVYIFPLLYVNFLVSYWFDSEVTALFEDIADCDFEILLWLICEQVYPK